MRIPTLSALSGEEANLRTTLRDGALWRTLALFALLLALVAQLPLHYAIDVGREDGAGSDLPLVRGMFPVEESPYGLFRWTTAHAMIRLPGIGQRPVVVTLKVLGINDEVATRGARELELWSSGQRLALLPVRRSGAVYHLLLSPPADRSGDYQIEIRSATITPTGDRRAVGTPLTTVVFSVGTGPALPPWRSTLCWLGAGIVLWVTLRQAGFASDVAQALMLPLLALVAFGAWRDPPRFAFGAEPALIALLVGWMLVVALRAAPEMLRLAGMALMLGAGVLWLIGWRGPEIDLGQSVVYGRSGVALAGLAFLAAAAFRPVLARTMARLGVEVPAMHVRWLLLIIAVVFATRYGGKIYPDSMPGDIGFHANRFADVVFGKVLLISRNRGVDFPYPPAFYLILAPFTLLEIDRRALLHLGAALLDAAGPFLMYVLALALYQNTVDASHRPSALPFPAPLIAAALYGLTPAGYLTTWWNFSTHIFTQFMHLLLITMLVLFWPMVKTAFGGSRARAIEHACHIPKPPQGAARPAVVFVALVVVQILVYLGHFGFWMNMSLLGGFSLAALAIPAPRRRDDALRALGFYGAAFVLAQTVVLLFFYSAYAGMFAQQLAATTTGGLTGLAGRAPASFDVLWRTLWDAGLRQHYGFFPLALLPTGLALLARNSPMKRNACHTPFRILATGTIVVACGFAVLPFLSGSTLSTRWLMFSAWLVAIGAAAGAAALWQRGWAGRVTTLFAGGYVAWVTASIWLTALLWRVRPPEPF
ncbi:hypothetical protein [Roseiflexus sp.]|uniref:hypothetical protein n=3 Tax=Roseiflexus sp. TaxID=2562120 RepID=UPI00398B402B